MGFTYSNLQFIAHNKRKMPIYSQLIEGDVSLFLNLYIDK